MEEGVSKLKKPLSILPHRKRVVKYTPKLHPMPEYMGKSATCMAEKDANSFSKELRRGTPPQLSHRYSAEGLADPLINDRNHRRPIDMPWGMNKAELEKPL